MSTDQNDLYDAIIVGAGPVGLSLANSLALKNYKVLVLEKNEAIAEHSRAPVIWPGTQEILGQLNVIDKFLQKSLQLPELRIWDADTGNILLMAPIRDLRSETAYAQILLLPQPETEGILLEALKSFNNVRVLFASEVVDLIQEADRVNIIYNNSGTPTKVHAKIVAGADGAHSFVRDKINASLAGKTYPMSVALADVTLGDIKNPSFFRVSSKKDLALAIPIRKNTWRIIFPINEKNTQRPLPDVLQAAVGRLFSTTRYECIWMSRFQIHNRISTSFCEGRVVLAGDAAHLNSPVGGQGMNSGIQDIVPLVAAIVKTLNSNNTTPLSLYATQRKEKIKKGVNRFTDMLTNIFLGFANGRLIKHIFRFINFCMRFPWLKMKILKKMAMIN